jgi:hypothetical protein
MPKSNDILLLSRNNGIYTGKAATSRKKLRSGSSTRHSGHHDTPDYDPSVRIHGPCTQEKYLFSMSCRRLGS